MNTDTPIEPPPGCVEISGFILPVFGGKFWFTKDGDLTRVWSKRGVWPTAEAAREAKARFCAEPVMEGDK